MTTPNQIEQETWGLDGQRQSAVRERIRVQLIKMLPDYDFTRYPVMCLSYKARYFDQPAWSIVAVRKSDGERFDVSCMESMRDCLTFGMQAFSIDAQEHWIQVMTTPTGE